MSWIRVSSIISQCVSSHTTQDLGKYLIERFSTTTFCFLTAWRILLVSSPVCQGLVPDICCVTYIKRGILQGRPFSPSALVKRFLPSASRPTNSAYLHYRYLQMVIEAMHILSRYKIERVTTSPLRTEELDSPVILGVSNSQLGRPESIYPSISGLHWLQFRSVCVRTAWHCENDLNGRPVCQKFSLDSPRASQGMMKNCEASNPNNASTTNLQLGNPNLHAVDVQRCEILRHEIYHAYEGTVPW